ncbi:MAG: hypothetical protein XXXJIFNMEKO3_02038 [Candidatus Erwinia impunctatus]|nr:hypothetical protein XXXJIFNMEKO_02038 [Culicoides impunctatus]
MDLETLLVQSRRGQNIAPAHWLATLRMTHLLIPRDLTHTACDASKFGGINAGMTIIPVFTSPGEWRRVSQSQGEIRLISGMELLILSSGNAIYINPGSSTGRFFSGEEVKAICAEEQQIEQQTLCGNSAIRISAHSAPPEAMIAELCQCFRLHHTVRAAYLAWVREIAEETPTLLIAIASEACDQRLIQQVGELAVSFMPDDEAVDVYLMGDESTGIDHLIMTHLTPFYQRRWGSFLREYQHG